MVGLHDAFDAAQEITDEASPAPTPSQFERVASAEDVKARLDWGEPAFTIIDVRDRKSFNDERITGAIFVPPQEVVNQVSQMLETNRDIYIYGSSHEDTINAASQLDQAGFQRVSVLAGGIEAWKAVNGEVEGRNA